tara:strand:- start:47 stop:397 length:351 start_codon:yes stop_codon:yes gene_type:complete
MAKKIKAEDKINDTTLHEFLSMIDAKINHIEDITADNRAIIVKLVKQNNEIVKFLKGLELEIVEGAELSDVSDDDKLVKLMKLVEEFKDSNEEFKKFIEEMDKYKDQLTPGQFGDS